MGNLDAPQNLADRAEARFGMAEPSRLGVDMASPENRAIFQSSGEQGRPVLEDGQLSFNSTDIYGGASTSGAAAFDNPANASTIANLTPEQAAVYGSVVQLSTPIVTVGDDGKLTESTSQGTGFVFTGSDGQQYIGTAGHVTAATGTNDQPNTTAYAEGPTQVTFADGTTGYSNVVANRSANISDNDVQTGDPGDIAVMSMPYRPSVLQPIPSLTISADAPKPGDNLSSVGYGDGKLTTTSGTYEQNVNIDGVDMQATTGPGIHGQSGSPDYGANNEVQGIWDAGTNHGGTDGVNFSVPATNLTALSDTTSWLNPNYLSNLVNATPQPIATPDSRGNSIESVTQPVTGVTLPDGTYLQQPDKYLPTPDPVTDAAPAPAAQSTSQAPVDAAPATVGSTVDFGGGGFGGGGDMMTMDEMDG